jgi:hypothetical protein
MKGKASDGESLRWKFREICEGKVDELTVELEWIV